MKPDIMAIEWEEPKQGIQTGEQTENCQSGKQHRVNPGESHRGVELISCKHPPKPNSDMIKVVPQVHRKQSQKQAMVHMRSHVHLRLRDQRRNKPHHSYKGIDKIGRASCRERV